MKNYSEINVIMPMLGRGERMQGFQNTCKPLMKLPDGDPFFLRALSSLKGYKVNTLVLVVLREYKHKFYEYIAFQQIKKYIKYNNLVFICADPTANPVESIRAGLFNMRDKTRPIVILDCDIYAPLPKVEMTSEEFGTLFYFNDKTGNKSYLKEDGGKVTEIAEKKLISNNAIFGAYLCTQPELLEELVFSGKYSYVSEIFDTCIDKTIKAQEITSVMNFGTIEELKKIAK